MATVLWLTLIIGRLLISSASALSSNNVSYSIVAPKAFRTGSMYNMTISCYRATGNVFMMIRLTAVQNGSLVDQREVIANGETKIVSLQIPSSVPDESYKLVVSGSGGLQFSHERSVTVNRQTLLLYVQTDKAMYKPGDTVLFRAIAVHPDLRPYKDFVDITVFDLAGNKIMQWLKQKSDAGVITQQLPLSEQTPLGEWKITVTAREDSLTKTFEVAEYVLPKFEVSVAVPPFYVVNVQNPDRQHDLMITVTAKYTYGQMVKGKATVLVKVKHMRYERVQKSADSPKLISIELKNGKADIRLTMSDLLGLRNDWTSWESLVSRTIQVNAEVEETITGIVLVGNATVDCKRHRHTLKFLSMSPSNYKPGLLYTGFVHLAQADGSPPDPEDIKEPDGSYRSVEIRATFYTHSYYNTQRTIQVPIVAPGYMMFSLQIDSNTSRVYLEASFKEVTTSGMITDSKNLQHFKSRDKQGIQVAYDGLHGVIKAPSEAKFTVKTTEEITSFQYEVLSKENILLSDNVVGLASTEHSFSFWISKELAMKLAPTARILVWFITNNGEIITDSTEISVSEIFANEVSLSFDRESTTPSQNVSLTINAYQGSYVGLLAVDQSVLLLKGGNDITQNMVLEGLKKFSVSSGAGADESGGHMRWMWWPYFIDGSHSQMIIDKCGLFVFTDAYIHNNRIYDDYDHSKTRYRMLGMKVPNVQLSGKVRVPASAPAAKAAVSDTIITSAESSVESTPPRINFPETWLWTDLVTGADGKVILQTNVPDTITSWVASAFAISDVTGLGVASSTARLTVFKQFFLSTTLPYSVIRGEEFALQVTVFNYMSIQLDVLVTMKDSKFFTVGSNSSVLVKVDSDEAASVFFWIVPGSLGQIPIEIMAQSPVAGDAVTVLLLVKPEGIQQRYSTSVFVQLSSSDPDYSGVLDISLPPSDRLVQGSEYVEVTVIGDLMGPSIKGLDNLLQMPCGCGEQNMLHFAPDVYIVKYLSIADQLTVDLKRKALGFMNAGYQRELTYQRSDGSFSAFGNSDQSGSVWLSAFVIKCFHQAKDYIAVDDGKIAQTLRWILANQEKNGLFVEPHGGRVIHKDMQGGSSRGLPLTAFVLIAVLENEDNSQVGSISVSQKIAKTRAFLEQMVSTAASDPYTLSIIAYALARAQSSKVGTVLGMLEALAKVEAGMKHWEKPAAATDEDVMGSWHPPYEQAKAVNIEMTSYVLLTYCHLKNLSMSLPIAKWIVAQRNANGGFSSTQDTVMALEALASFASMTTGPSGERNLQVSIATDRMQHRFQPITGETALLLQSYEVPANTSQVTVSATGQGSVLIQMNVQYNVFNTIDKSGIRLRVVATELGGLVTIKSCGSWKEAEESGMVVMEINQLTGFKALNVDDLKKQGNEVIKRVENKDDKVILYLDELSSEEICVKLISEKVFPVNNLQDAPVKVYPYYDPSGARTMFYRAPRSLTQNSVCEECPQCCGEEPRPPRQRQNNASPSFKSGVSVFSTVIVLVLLHLSFA